MRRYANSSGNSGVVAYATSSDGILVRFAGGDIYEYTAQKPGAAIVARMKALATHGKGLSTYIAQEVRENYFRKLAT